MRGFAPIVLVAAAAACAPPSAPAPHEPAPPSAPTVATAPRTDAGAEPRAAAAPPARPPPEVLFTDPALVASLDAAGYDLGTLLGDGSAHGNDALAHGARYADLARTIAEDVAAAKRADPSSGVGLGFGHRLFDARLLRDRDARWELVGIAQRFDRDFADPSRCGELRFVFRLRYDKTVKGLAIASRMPATAAVSFWNASGASDCTPVMKDWAARVADPARPRLPSPAELAPRFKAVELDVQTVRWPSTIRGDMAGHAEYSLRALVPAQGGAHLAPGPLENTPDVARARRDRAYRAKLLAWIVDPANARAIDEGRAVLPADLDARAATDVTPHGFARRKNRPFRDLFAPSEVRAIEGAALARSGEGVLRRLDGMSCPGCHASRSVAGFHLLGDETAPSGSVNAVLVGRSPHLIDELARRRRELARRIGQGGEPEPIPFADRTSGRGERGAHCGLGADPTFASWTCAKGLACVPDVGSAEDGVGVCADRAAPRPGDACEVGRMKASSDPHADRVVALTPVACAGACDDNQVGFPDGTCVGSCDALGEGAVCGAIPRLVGFNTCLASSATRSFEACILANATPAAVQACDEARPCRDDYICARTRDGQGACMPPYFLFQLRVDGHP